ncbi:MAG: aldehyde dehydrogenase family protein [bacterium]|nr:aldehyde dehydrogenase family protein [bacterium]MCP5067336.1 aldehyde dehydrogenase family protein [bacterium]
MALEALAPETRNLIDGERVEASNGKRFENLNPATEDVIGNAPDGTRDDMQAALAAARRAFDETDWATDAAFRARCLRQLHQGLVEEKEQLRSIVVNEAGACVSATGFMHVDEPIEMMAYWAELAEAYEYETEMATIPFGGRESRRRLRREPIGVVGAITPWNVPLYLNIAKIGPSLAAGCSLVLKPAPDTPWSATHIGKIIAEKTDLPPGVVNIVASSDHLTGEVLSGDPRVDLVTFTGSTATGRRVMENASATVKKAFLELGGKSASIVLDDAKLEAVLPGAAMTCIHGGQGCALTTRWLVPRSRYEEAVEIIKAAFEAWNWGDPTDPSNLQGPQISKRQQERVLGYIEQGRQEGARCLVGGGRPDRKGFFVEPTLFVDVEPAMTIARQEIFGPVCCVLPYDDEDEAVRIANDSIYGLSGAVYSGDDERALAVARRIRTGTISVNGGMWFHVSTPFGGYGQSGLGRENGVMGFEEHLETKVIALPTR